jgi:predicted SAM-dependent methyltransferase
MSELSYQLRRIRRVIKQRWTVSAQIRRRPALIDDYYRQHQVIKLNIGCGPVLKPGWLNVDIEPIDERVVYMNAAERFPLPGESVDFAYSEHMIEHVSSAAGEFLLGEVHRVLKRGGWVRIATPDLDNVVRLQRPALTEGERNYVAWSNRTFGDTATMADNPCYTVNRMFREWGHQFLYDVPTLRQTLERGGFTNVRLCEIGKSTVADLCDLEIHGTQIGDEYNALETFIIEAQKPA